MQMPVEPERINPRQSQHKPKQKPKQAIFDPLDPEYNKKPA